MAMARVMHIGLSLGRDILGEGAQLDEGLIDIVEEGIGLAEFSS